MQRCYDGNADAILRAETEWRENGTEVRMGLWYAGQILACLRALNSLPLLSSALYEVIRDVFVVYGPIMEKSSDLPTFQLDLRGTPLPVFALDALVPAISWTAARGQLLPLSEVQEVVRELSRVYKKAVDRNPWLHGVNQDESAILEKSSWITRALGRPTVQSP